MHTRQALRSNKVLRDDKDKKAAEPVALAGV